MILKIIYITILFILFMIFTPWWGFSLISFLIGMLINSKTKNKIIIAITSSAISWIACFIFKYYNGGEIITYRVASMLGINTFILFLGTILIVSSISFLACYIGSLVKKEFMETK